MTIAQSARRRIAREKAKVCIDKLHDAVEDYSDDDDYDDFSPQKQRAKGKGGDRASASKKTSANAQRKRGDDESDKQQRSKRLAASKTPSAGANRDSLITNEQSTLH